MIAWNGTEEILLLSTDLKASESTKVLEVLPLPSEPKVTKGDLDVFRRATTLINRKVGDETKNLNTRDGVKIAEPAGEITFHEKIGAHNISVARVLDPRGFVEWVNDYLKKAGVSKPVVPKLLKASVTEYINDKFTWVVFDVVDLDDKTKTNDAIQYRFKTGSLFYPLRISRTDTGETSIDLLILTPRLLTEFSGFNTDLIELRQPPIGVPPNFDPLAMRDLVGFMVRVGLVVGRCFAAAGA
jgi:hypothetical protein